jgi:hypothetical protein
MRHAFFVVACPTFSVNASENLSDHAQFCAPVAAQSCGNYLQQPAQARTYLQQVIPERLGRGTDNFISNLPLRWFRTSSADCAA